MTLDLNILVDFAVAITFMSYVRVAPVARAATLLGSGSGCGVTRFASPTKTFTVIYLGRI